MSVEKYIENLPDIKGAFVVNVDMNLTAFIIAENPDRFDREQALAISKSLKHSEGQIICPDRYVLVKDLTRNQNGKKIRIKPADELVIRSVEV